MSDHTIPIAPIPLARSTGRMLVAPMLLLAAGAAAVVAGMTVGGLVGIGLVAAGLVVAALSLYLTAMLLTVRLDVEVATLYLRWLGGERRYTLVRGPVTRVALQGGEAARLRPHFGALGWAIGRARLRRDETVDVVRLAPTATMILVPTDRGRLGIAPESEERLLSALSAAARIQQRLDEVAERARAYMELPSAAEVAAALAPPPERVPAREGRRMLTGIERQLLEERLAADRAAALQRAEAERVAAIRAAAAAVLAAPAADDASASPSGRTMRERRRMQWRRPAWLALRRAAKPAAGDIAASGAPITAAQGIPAAEPTRVREAITVAESVPARPPRFSVRDGQWLAFGLALTPVIGAGVVWLVASMRGELALPLEELRPIALALLAIGPAGALAALAARAWYPRLQGLVTLTALTGLVLVGRILLG